MRNSNSMLPHFVLHRPTAAKLDGHHFKLNTKKCDFEIAYFMSSRTRYLGSIKIVCCSCHVQHHSTASTHSVVKFVGNGKASDFGGNPSNERQPFLMGAPLWTGLSAIDVYWKACIAFVIGFIAKFWDIGMICRVKFNATNFRFYWNNNIL